ncbi:terminase small subunit [Sulfuricurvum sp.]|uniref:terminase small subunit n=1 Tax=Sulfuricurvum sp. TaxID=2025608 RepID=UPI003C6AD3EB
MEKLTLKQERFVSSYLETGNASEAYRVSYEVQNMKPESINRKATELMQNGNITARIGELRNELVKSGIWSREDSVKKLKEALSIADKATDIVSVVKELNAMHGYNAPQKIEVEERGQLHIYIPKRDDNI